MRAKRTTAAFGGTFTDLSFYYLVFGLKYYFDKILELIVLTSPSNTITAY